MNKNTLNDFFLFAIGQLNMQEIEQIIYQHNDLENILEEELYIELISFDFNQAEARKTLLDFFLTYLFSQEDLFLWSKEYYAPIIEEISAFIINTYKKLPLGLSIDKLIDQKENYSKKEGHDPHYKLTKEFGEVEEMGVYYKHNKNILTGLVLIFESPLTFYYKEMHGNDGLLEHAIQNGKAQLYAVIHNLVCSKVIDYFNSILGKPSVEQNNDSGLFNQPHHQYHLYKWTLPNAETNNDRFLYLMKYIDDSTWHQINAFMKISLVD